MTTTAFAAAAAPATARVRMRTPTCSASGSDAQRAAPDRRAFLRTGAALALLAMPGVANARRTGSMSGEYKSDAAKVLDDMRQACELSRGAPGVVDTVTRTREEMNDFVALYRRNDKVSGSTSFSTLYTAINTLSGHYASYGNQYPVPDKRKKRLNQQFNEIDRALSRGR